MGKIIERKIIINTNAIPAPCNARLLKEFLFIADILIVCRLHTITANEEGIKEVFKKGD